MSIQGQQNWLEYNTLENKARHIHMQIVKRDKYNNNQIDYTSMNAPCIYKTNIKRYKYNSNWIVSRLSTLHTNNKVLLTLSLETYFPCKIIYLCPQSYLYPCKDNKIVLEYDTLGKEIRQDIYICKSKVIRTKQRPMA